MVHKRSWTAPPTRREITLVLFSLTIFVLSYNLETSLGLVGVHPQKLTSTYLSSIGLGSKDPGYDDDGRRPKPWRDELEDLIAGEWEWREGEVSGAARGHDTSSGTGRYAMIYNFASEKKGGRQAEKGDTGVSLSTGVTVKDQYVRWGKDIPQTTVVAHTPGFTILENVISVNGTLFMVANDWTTVPKLADIASSSIDPSRPPRVQDFHILTASDASQWFGPSALKIHGTSWLALDKAESQDPYLLLSLFRTHASLMSSTPSAQFTTPEGLRIISPSAPAVPANSVSAPLRLILPHIPTFSSPHIPPAPGEDGKTHPPPRERAYTGMHPLIPKTVLPTLGLWFEEDWKDLADMHVPILLERVVLADRGASERGRANWQNADAAADATTTTSNSRPGSQGEPVWAAPFVGLNAPEGWWAPARAALLRHLRIPNEYVPEGEADAGVLGALWSKKEVRKPVVSYVSMQEAPRGAGARLSRAAHERLVEGLRSLEREGVLGEVHVLSGNGSVPAREWEERMGAIARSTIMIGPYGHQLADAVFMRSPLAEPKPSPAAAAGHGQNKHNKPKADARYTGPPPLLMEFFPPGTFVRDQQYAMQALGIDYFAWWDEMRFASTALPSVASQSSVASDPVVPIDVEAVLSVVRQEAPRRVFA